MRILTSLADLICRLPAQAGVVVHSGAAHPTVLGRKLAESAVSLRGRRVYALMPSGPVPYAASPSRELLDLATFLPGAALRAAMDSGRVLPLRQSLSTVPASFARGEFPVGAVLLRVSPPDGAGRVNLGVAVDYMRAAIDVAKIVVAEIDPQMPRVCGDCWLDASRIDAYVDAVDGPHELKSLASNAADEAIAGHIASLVEDGAVLQLGIGSLPDRVLAKLGHLKHLGLHTGIIGDGARPLIERGIIDNSQKALFPGVSVATMALGTKDLYQFLDRNAAIEMHPCSVTHSPAALRRLRRLVAINSALQIDLEGRVNAEWVGDRRVSLSGGLTDFARAAADLPDGRSVVAFRASDREGRSNILRSLGGRGEYSLLPGDVDFFVTEHGVASVRGSSAEQRRKSLITIANPEHRYALANI